MNPSRVGACLALLAGLLVGCTGGSGSLPASIEYGKDTCGHCGAVIRDAHFAGQYVLANGPVKKFDDPGCLVHSLYRESSPVTNIQLHARHGDQWLTASEAWLARTSETSSPQGYGWGAYGSFGEAQEAVTRAGNGELLPFEDAKKRIAQSPTG